MSEPKIEGSNGNGTTTAPVYLRLQKRAQAESKRSRPTPEQLRMRALSLGFLVMSCATCALWLLTRYVDTDPQFHVRRIDLRGGKFVSAAEVENVFLPDREISIYRIPLEERRRDLEKIPWVRAASITRVLPDRVVVNVEERQPVAFLWTRRGIELVDGDGVILPTPPGARWAFPVLRGVPERESLEKRRSRMERYRRLLEALRRQDGSLPPEISEVDLTDAANVSAVVTDAGGAVRLNLGNERFRERYAIYVSRIAEWRQQFHEIRSIDLRFEGQAVIQSGTPVTVQVNPKPGSPATPASATLRGSDPLPAAAPVRTAL